jgi:hypothetical protein
VSRDAVPVEQEIARRRRRERGAVTRVGDVVLRPPNPHTRAIGALLVHLHDVGFDAVPEPLGTAPDGREQ